MSCTVRVTHTAQQNCQYHSHIIVQVFFQGGMDSWNNPKGQEGGEDREPPLETVRNKQAL